MIAKNDKNLLKWVRNNIVDFMDKNDKSGLKWSSSRYEAKDYLLSIPKKERVQEYGFYSATEVFCLVEEFDDIKLCLESGLISINACRQIYEWNSEIGRENWNMDDVEDVLYSDFGCSISGNFLYNTIKHLIDLGVMESFKSDGKGDLLFRLTEKGEMVLKDVY